MSAFNTTLTTAATTNNAALAAFVETARVLRAIAASATSALESGEDLLKSKILIATKVARQVSIIELKPEDVAAHQRSATAGLAFLSINHPLQIDRDGTLADFIESAEDMVECNRKIAMYNLAVKGAKIAQQEIKAKLAREAMNNMPKETDFFDEFTAEGAAKL